MMGAADPCRVMSRRHTREQFFQRTALEFFERPAEFQHFEQQLQQFGSSQFVKLLLQQQFQKQFQQRGLQGDIRHVADQDRLQHPSLAGWLFQQFVEQRAPAVREEGYSSGRDHHRHT